MYPQVQKRIDTLLANLSADFELAKLSKSPARFNKQKLDWFNKQFLQMMSLEEFSYRAAENKIFRSQQLNGNFRVGDYVMFVDLEQQKVFCALDLTKPLYLIGGGRDVVDPIDNLVKEIDEELPNNLDIKKSLFKKLTSFRVSTGENFTQDGTEYQGRELNIYLYPLQESQILGFPLKSVDFDWVDIQLFLLAQNFLTYPIWRQFSMENNLELPNLTRAIQTQYLAWFLDKNRITILSEFGVESEAILAWKKPEVGLLAWKKMTPDQAKDNLGEIWKFIQQTLIKQEFVELQKRLYEVVLEPDLSDNFAKVTNYLEQEIKTWLTENNKNTGEYLWPLRVALSGKKQSSSPFELLAILDFTEVSRRVELLLAN